jgi:hypothetical protein
MRMYDHKWIIIYFGTLCVEKLELLACRVDFRGKSHFGVLGSKKFQRLIKALKD